MAWVKMTGVMCFINFSGDPLTCAHWMASIEGKVVCEGSQPTLLHDLFNLDYQEQAACTLEFIQR